MADKIFPWTTIPEPPPEEQNYAWDCIDSEITEIPNLFPESWCYPGQFRTLARVIFATRSIIPTPRSFSSQADFVSVFSLPEIYKYVWKFTSQGDMVSDISAAAHQVRNLASQSDITTGITSVFQGETTCPAPSDEFDPQSPGGPGYNAPNPDIWENGYEQNVDWEVNGFKVVDGGHGGTISTGTFLKYSVAVGEICSLYSKYRLIGDFDLELKDAFFSGGNRTFFQIRLMNEKDGSYTSGHSMYWYNWNGTRWWMDKYFDGAAWQTLTQRTRGGNSPAMRMTRVGHVVSVYWWSTSWQFLTSWNHGSADPWWVNLYYSASTGIGGGQLDYFRVNSFDEIDCSL